MLQVVIPEMELWDERIEEFVTTNKQPLQLEHSLISISKWESTWCKPFWATGQKTTTELLDYIRCMTINQNVPPETYHRIPNNILNIITNYINADMTATWFSEDKTPKTNNKIITSEVIYYWMITYNIPSEYEKWHLNRLMTLIRVCNVENQPEKKRSRSEMLRDRKQLNDARRAQYNSKG